MGDSHDSSHIQIGDDAQVLNRAIPGFLVTGYLFALLGALLPAWGQQIRLEPLIAGQYFLALALGMMAAALASETWNLEGRLSAYLSAACGLATAALVGLAFLSPPANPWFRFGALFVTGVSLGLLHKGLFHAITPEYQKSPAATVMLGGAFFGMGSLAASLLLAAAFYAFSITVILCLMALLPASFAVVYARSRFAPIPAEPRPSWQQAFEGFGSLGAILFTLLLFFQFGNEWSLAGWLPVFLTHRIGLSSAGAILILALYWLALLVGRAAIYFALPWVSHGRLLIGSAAAAIIGCLLLLQTDNRLGASTAVLLIGAGFAAIYPLVSERIGKRFPYYHPGLFNGIFSFAFAGGLLSPWLLGFVVRMTSVRAVAVMPLVGTVMVAILLLLIWLEGKVTGR